MAELTAKSDTKSLSSMAKRLLQIIAVCESKISQATLLHLLKACGWADAPTKSGFVTQALLKPDLKSLVDRGFLESGNAAMTYSSIARPCQDMAVQQAVKAGNFKLIADAVEKLSDELDRDLTLARVADVTARKARRRARIAFYRGDVAAFELAKQELVNAKPELKHLGLLQPYDSELYAQVPLELQSDVLVHPVSQSILTGTGPKELMEAFDAFIQWHDNLSEEAEELWINCLAASGDINGLTAIAESDHPRSKVAAACAAFLTGRHEAAQAAFDEIISSMRKTTGKQSVVLPMVPGLMHLLLLLRKDDARSRAELKAFCATFQTQWPPALHLIPELFQLAAVYADAPSASSKNALQSALILKPAKALPLVKAFAVHVSHWFLPGEACYTWGGTLSQAAESDGELGLGWLAALCEDAAGICTTDIDPAALGQRHALQGTCPMLTWVQSTAIWKRKLDSLRQMVDGTPSAPKSLPASTGYDERMIWEMDIRESKKHCHASLSPFIQKLSGGAWTKGRPVALQRIHENHSKKEFAFLTDQDRAVCKCIVATERSTGYYRYTETVYHIDADAALPSLVGHPLIFSSGNRTQPIEITTRRPQLIIKKSSSGLQLQLDPQPIGDEQVVVMKDGAHRLVLVTFTREQLKLAGILDGVLDVPKSGEADVLATAKSLSSLLSVQSDVALKDNAADAQVQVKSVAAESRPHLHLLPFHAGIRAEFFVRPFGENGPFFAPGQGGENVFADVQGESVSTKRNLKLEKKQTNEIVMACPSLSKVADETLAFFEFSFADDALEMLLEIEPLHAKGKLTVHWPQGQSLKLAGSADSSQLRVRIERENDWFAASGELVVDELLTMDMLQLMEFVSVSPSRFVQVSDGRFLAITEQLRKRVMELSAYGDRRNNTLRIPQIRAAAMMDLDEWCAVKSDKHWKACLKRIRSAGDVVSEVPSTLNAELRDYQVEGFQWLCRLAHWGAGACLADDMGLGKTLQAIALLLHRGAKGPALVIAPTSVCFNWEAELQKFAPTLKPRIFGAGDREAFFKDLGPRDVVITSYGLLNNEAERLQAVQWHTAILDEAQAIKNTLTKRSQAAMSLSADFRLILTGTPIENHLGELWNLLQFINPGLLGSIEQFHERFALPIERDKNPDARQNLKRLVQPFLLRRTKTQVLSELPPRTEVTVPVTMPDDEALLYEAARQRAVKELTKKTDDARGQHVKILAEIMRLRRACCHPSLLLPKCGLPGAKLTAFSETIDELLENKHKALVFSQFVDHLSILRAELDRKQVKYQYLDGSTPMKERKRSVEAFQNGEGDVFLISLKAGGTGLNLTAADYVLHMDPWWNPAVEDQAADRAHRMGQLRPVTIYRFITRGTIEDKILALHTTKRDLADSLLEGTDTTGRLSTEELLALIR